MTQKRPRRQGRRSGLKPGWLFVAALAAGTAWWLWPSGGPEPVGAQVQGAPTYGYRVVNEYPHDPTAFTQGLIYRDGFLFESTGLNGQSSLRKVRLETGEVVQRQDVESMYFAEGLTDWQDNLIQLTWQANIAFVYDLPTFEVARTFPVAGEGWGLTHDNERLIMSDGSDVLRFMDPETHEVMARVAVRDRGRAVDDLNELEFVKGEILANVWQSDRLARIAPDSGRVTGWIDLTGLLPSGSRASIDAVLNGIAYDAATDRLFVTGKLWPTLFEIAIAPLRSLP